MESKRLYKYRRELTYKLTPVRRQLRKRQHSRGKRDSLSLSSASTMFNNIGFLATYISPEARILSKPKLSTAKNIHFPKNSDRTFIWFVRKLPILINVNSNVNGWSESVYVNDCWHLVP